jgi:hypothetical protein
MSCNDPEITAQARRRFAQLEDGIYAALHWDIPFRGVGQKIQQGISFGSPKALTPKICKRQRRYSKK